MPPAPPSDPYANTRASPRFAFDALVKVVLPQSDKPRQFWSRSTDISQGGIGVNLIGDEVKPDELASLQIPIPKHHPVELRASLRYRNVLHSGFEFVALDEGQRTAIRTACEALARSQLRSKKAESMGPACAH